MQKRDLMSIMEVLAIRHYFLQLLWEKVGREVAIWQDQEEGANPHFLKIISYLFVLVRDENKAGEDLAQATSYYTNEICKHFIQAQHLPCFTELKAAFIDFDKEPSGNIAGVNAIKANIALILSKYYQDSNPEESFQFAKQAFKLRHWQEIQEAKLSFLNCHETFKNAQSASFFRRTHVHSDMSLEEMLEHGMRKKGRSREVCAALGWLKKDGSIEFNAPSFIVELVSQQNQIKLTL